ncbi:MAG: response regulator [Lachnospiraceae bacterium]|nr:response regulator [Lachnospiraceae bacterium]
MRAAMYPLSFNIAAFIFNIALCVLVTANGTEDKHSNHTFRNFTYIILVGNIITCCDQAFGRDPVVMIPNVPRLALYVLSFLFNSLLTYFFTLYAETFFEETKTRRFFSTFNRFLMAAIIVMAVVCFIIKLPHIGPDRPSYYLPDIPGYILAYYSELYFLLYAMIVFFVGRKDLNRRARITAFSAFAVTIGVIVFEIFNTTGILFNYFGPILSLYIFYIGVETPDYKNLLATMDKLEEARKRADEANRSKSEFLANMSHEIRTPINAVIGMNEMIIREAGDEKIIEYAHNIESAGRSLLSIINDILDLSKIEAGKMKINEAPYKFSSLLNDAVVMISVKAKEKNLTFDVNVDETLPDGLYGDELRVRQILVNVLNNAVKYTEKGKINLSVNYDRKDTECILIIKVSDTGIGIRREDIPKLFEKFDRVDLNKNKAVEGTGLGLAIVKRLLSMMQGTIEVESEYGVGSTFFLRIPQQIRSNEPIGDYRTKYRKATSGGYRELFHAPDARILVVDDTLINLTVVRALLKKTGISIETATSAAEAIIKAKEKHYDTILLDNRMPGMDGAEALPIIRSQKDGMNLNTPIICLTADAVSGARERYLSEGFTDYLTKPIESTALERMLIKYLPSDKVTKNGQNNT